MSNLSIHQWSGDKREVHFVGYNRDHTACFIRDEQKSRRAITLLMPNLFDLRFYDDLIGQHGSRPVTIRRTALHRPACFATQQEKIAFDNPRSLEAQCALTMLVDVWKVRSHHKCWLEPKDDKKLSILLREQVSTLRRRYTIREKETADQIAALPPGETKSAEELRNMLRGEFTTTTRGKNGAFKFISIFDTTLEMARGGWGGLREQLLEREWAEHFSWNLDTIPTEAAAFHIWLEKRAYNARQTTKDLNTRTVEIGVGLRLDPWQWEILEAAVLYEIRFADGTRCWLNDIEERGVTDPHEVDDFDRLEEAAEPASDDRLSLETVLEKLGSERKGKHKPMGIRGFKKLCEREKINFEQVRKRGMQPSLLDKLLKKRHRQKRSRVERLKRINATNQLTKSTLSIPSDNS